MVSFSRILEAGGIGHTNYFGQGADPYRPSYGQVTKQMYSSGERMARQVLAATSVVASLGAIGTVAYGVANATGIV